MRLKLILPRIEPEVINLPEVCPYRDCRGHRFQHHQVVYKMVKDTVYEEVLTQRHKCLRCGRTFRVYPVGVGRAQTSQRVTELAVMLYLVGAELWGAVSLVLEALKVYLDKTSVLRGGASSSGAGARDEATGSV